MIYDAFMKVALGLAVKGAGYVAPNPLVGAVIVRHNKIIGQGYHKYFGGPHAEINAINSVRNPGHINGSTLCLTLEPCSHFGKTPPCAPAIISCGIKNVVIAARDPNPLVSGRGIRALKQHDINIIEGVLKTEAQRINAPFFKAQQKGLPYVIAKWAMSQDGWLISRPGQPRWITSEKSRNYARGIRAQSQAIMVGIGTVLKDNPGLMADAQGKDNPVRVILDSRARLPLHSRLITTIARGPVWIITADSASRKKTVCLERKGVLVLRVPRRDGRLNFRAALRMLVKSGIHKLMIEGGPEVLASAFYYKAVDEVFCFIAPRIIGDNSNKNKSRVFRPADALDLRGVTARYLKPDVLVHGFVKTN